MSRTRSRHTGVDADVFGLGGAIIGLDGWAVTSAAELSLVAGWDRSAGIGWGRS